MVQVRNEDIRDLHSTPRTIGVYQGNTAEGVEMSGECSKQNISDTSANEDNTFRNHIR